MPTTRSLRWRGRRRSTRRSRRRWHHWRAAVTARPTAPWSPGTRRACAGPRRSRSPAGPVRDGDRVIIAAVPHVPFTHFELPLPTLVTGLVGGLTYAMLGIGLTLTY